MAALPIVYLAIALTLIASEDPAAPGSVRSALDMSAMMKVDLSTLPAQETYKASDGRNLHLRTYGDPQTAQRTLILIHGSGWHGLQFHTMARTLASKGGTFVAVPDLRGHGQAPQRRGDIEYVGQLEADLSALIDHLRSQLPDRPVVIGGHSSGGGFAIRFAGGRFGDDVDGYLLIAPFLQYDAPTTRPNSGGWAHPAIRRIIGLSMLDRVGIKALNGLPGIAFAMPDAVRDGPLGDTATTQYTYRMNTALAPRDFTTDLEAIEVPLLLVAGTEDEAFYASRYEPTIDPHIEAGSYKILPDAGHIDILTDPRATAAINDWLIGTYP